jgi:hypothetical protein
MAHFPLLKHTTLFMTLLQAVALEMELQIYAIDASDVNMGIETPLCASVVLKKSG